MLQKELQDALAERILARVPLVIDQGFSPPSDEERADVAGALAKYKDLDLTREYYADIQTMGESPTLEDIDEILATSKHIIVGEGNAELMRDLARLAKQQI